MATEQTVAPSLAQALAAGPVVLDGGLSNQLEAQGADLRDSLWSARLLADDPAQITAAHVAYYAAGAQVVITSSYQASFQGFATRGIDHAHAAQLLRRSIELAREAEVAAAEQDWRDQATAERQARSNATAQTHVLDGASADRSVRDGAARPQDDRGVRDGAAHRQNARDQADDERHPRDQADAHRTAAVGTSPRPRWVAASVGPYGAILADGSEYRGRYGLSVADLEAFHALRFETLAGAMPDVLALETIPDIDEAVALMNLVRGSGVPCWLSFSAVGRKTRAGQPLTEAFAVAADVDEVIAVGVNCCAPQDVRAAVEIASSVTGKPVVVYPNSGESWDAKARAWREESTFDAGLVRSWIDAGARLIGGCCRVGPDAIRQVSAVVNERAADLAAPRTEVAHP